MSKDRFHQNSELPELMGFVEGLGKGGRRLVDQLERYNGVPEGSEGDQLRMVLRPFYDQKAHSRLRELDDLGSTGSLPKLAGGDGRLASGFTPISPEAHMRMVEETSRKGYVSSRTMRRRI